MIELRYLRQSDFHAISIFFYANNNINAQEFCLEIPPGISTLQHTDPENFERKGSAPVCYDEDSATSMHVHEHVDNSIDYLTTHTCMTVELLKPFRTGQTGV